MSTITTTPRKRKLNLSWTTVRLLSSARTDRMGLGGGRPDWIDRDHEAPQPDSGGTWSTLPNQNGGTVLQPAHQEPPEASAKRPHG